MKFKRLFISIIFIMLIFLCFLKPVNANFFTDDWDDKSQIEETVDNDEGGLFEKIIAKMIRRTCRNSF